MMESIIKPFSYINIKNEKKYHFYSPISESTIANTEFDSSGSDNDYSTTPPQVTITNKIQTNDVNSYTQSDPSKLIYVPKSLSQEFNNTENSSTAVNNENENTVNQKKDVKFSSPSSTMTNQSTKKELKPKRNINLYQNSTTLSTLNKSKKLLPWYMKKRQTTFTKNDLSTFYTYNKCSNYDKYENYYSRNQPVKDNIADISLDKTAIELKELHPKIEMDVTEVYNTSQQEKSEFSENTDNTVENEIAHTMNGIALKKVTFNTNQIDDISRNNELGLGPSSSRSSDSFIENVTYEFQPESAYPVVSDNNNNNDNNIYPNSYELKDNNDNHNTLSPTQYPVLPTIENFTIDEFVC